MGPSLIVESRSIITKNFFARPLGGGLGPLGPLCLRQWNWQYDCDRFHATSIRFDTILHPESGKTDRCPNADEFPQHLAHLACSRVARWTRSSVIVIDLSREYTWTMCVVVVTVDSANASTSIPMNKCLQTTTAVPRILIISGASLLRLPSCICSELPVFSYLGQLSLASLRGR